MKKILLGITTIFVLILTNCSSNPQNQLVGYWTSTQNRNEQIAFYSQGNWKYIAADNYSFDGNKYRVVNSGTLLQMWDSSEGLDKGFTNIELVKLTDTELILNFNNGEGIKTFKK